MFQRGRLLLQFSRRIIARWVSIFLPSRMGRVTSLFSSLRITRESEEHGVSRWYFGTKLKKECAINNKTCVVHDNKACVVLI